MALTEDRKRAIRQKADEDYRKTIAGGGGTPSAKAAKLPQTNKTTPAAAVIRARQEAKGVLPVSSELKRGYYSRPDVDGRMETAYQTIERLTPSLAEKKKELGNVQLALTVTENLVTSRAEEAMTLAQKYQQQPDKLTAALYDSVYKQYEAALKNYQNAETAYGSALGAYTHVERLLGEAVSAYKGYADQLAQWKDTVRDSGTVQGELAELQKQIALQEAHERQAARTVQPGAYLQGAGGVQTPYGAALSAPQIGKKQNSPEMQALLDRQTLLMEELDWSRQFAQEAEDEKWRSTARDVSTVKAELAALEEQIALQEAHERQAARTVQPGAYLQGAGSVQTPYGAALSAPQIGKKQNSPEMQALLDRQTLLLEELDWSRQFAQEAEDEKWRSTARDVSTVKAELAALEEQIALQEADERQTARTVQPGAYLQGAGGVQTPYGAALSAPQIGKTQNSPEMQALLDKREQLETELGWSKGNYYAALAGNTDFQELSKYRSTRNGNGRIDPLRGVYTDTGFEDTAYDYINRNEEAVRRRDINALGDSSSLLGMDGSQVKEMKDEEIATFNYLYATEGREAAYEYIAWLNSDLNKRQRKTNETAARKFAQEHPVIASLGSIAGAPLKGISYLGQAADLISDGRIDQNAGYNKFSYSNSAVRDQVSKTIEKNAHWGKAGSFLYQTAMSMGDFLLTSGITGGSPALALTVMGTGAAADTVIAAKDRGLSDGQAFALGTVAGLAEAVTEKVSLDALLNADLLKDSTWKYILKNMLAEGSEEVGSDLINLTADILISKEKSEWQTAVNDYMRSGMSESQAFGQAVKDQALTLGLDLLGGAISGGIMGGGNAVIRNVGNRAAERQGKTGENAEQPPEAEPDEPQTIGEDIARQIKNNWSDNPEPKVTVLPEANVGEEVVRSAQRIAKATGRDIVFYSQYGAAKGMQHGKYRDGTIYINSRSENPMAQIFSHELTHSVEKAGAYKDLSAIVMKRIQDTGGDLRRLRQAKAELYAQNGHPLKTQADIDAEIVAEYVEKNLLTNEQSIVSLTQENPGLGRKILNWIDELLAKLGNKDAQARAFLNNARTIYARALNQSHAMSAVQTQTGTQVPTGSESGNSQALEEAVAQPGEQTVTEGSMEAQRRQLDEQLRAGQITEEEYDSSLEALEAWVLESAATGEQYSISEKKPGWQVQGNQEIQGLQIPMLEDVQKENTAREGGENLYDGIDLSQDGNIYSYDFLTSLPDMQVVQLPEVPQVRNEAGKVDKTKVVEQGIKNALSVGTERDGKIYVTNRYTKHKLRVDVGSIRHGLDGDMNRILTNARLGSVIGEVVQNAVPINALYDTAKNVTGTYAMAGYANDSRGREFIAIITVEQSNGNVAGAEIYDVTHAVSGRQKKRQAADTKSQGVNPFTLTSSITIKDLLDSVKGTYQSILSNDVLLNMGETKNPEGYYTERTKFSITAPNGEKDAEGAQSAYHSRKDIVDDIVHEQASRDGFPVIKGQQIIPYRTWVFAQDIVRDKITHEPKLDKEGNPYRWNNYGLVTGIAGGNKLWVHFENKFEQGRDGKNIQEDVAVDYEDMTPVSAAYQMTDEERESLDNSAPVDPDEQTLSLEEQMEVDAAVEALLQKAKEKEGTTTREEYPPVKREELKGKARDGLDRAERKLLNKLSYELGISRMARRENLLPVLQDICDAYLENDTVSNEKVDELFDKAYEAGRVIEREFYDTYKEIKDHLRTTAVTISKQDQSNIADYGAFRRRAFGTLRIVTEGGLPVDVAYQELQRMAPALFPEDITHPADQLQHMYEVGKSIQVSEKSLDEAYGEDGRQFYREEFEKVLGDLVKEMRTVKRYAADKVPKENQEEAGEAASLQEIAQVWKNFKKARRAADKAVAKNLLTTEDDLKVGRLLKGELKLENLDPETDNVKGITAVYEAKREMEQHYAKLAEFKKRVKATRLALADHYLETADTWKDKKAGILYARETMARNIYDIVKDRKLAEQIVRQYFTPVQTAQANATRFKKEYRSKVAGLKLDTKVRSGNCVSEAHAVQLYGEAMDNIRMLEKLKGRMSMRDGKNLQEWQAAIRELWENNPNLDQAKIQKAVEEFRKIYDELLQKMNEIRIANGYEPVNYRQGYFPHFQPEGDGITALFGKAMGINLGIDTLPTTINGLTHTFKPGIQWFGNAQERLGFNTAYDAVKGFDKYIEGVASVIYQTENIQNLRALATQVRYRTSDEAIRKDVDAIKKDESKSEEDKRRAIDEIYEKRPCALSNFVNELDEYTNLLANKKSRFDRQAESDWGRRFYRFMNNVSSRVSMNMINGNLSSATTNFIPLTQAMGRIGVGHTLQGMYEAQKAIFRKDASMIDASTFLTNRRGSDPLVKVWHEKVADVLGWPMETIDNFVSESIVRAAYNKNRKDGLSETEALYQADIMAGSIMADRSKGALPTLFERKNPVTKLFTAFQVEVNNQFSEVFKDIPREHAEKAKWMLALCLLKYFIAAFAINELEEKVKGRRSALDPVGIAKQFAEDFREAGFAEAAGNLIVDTAGSLPFSTLASVPLAAVGVETDSGRVPVASAIPDFNALANAAFNDEWSKERRWATAGEELAKPLTYLASPFGGGNQFAKSIKGLLAYKDGGSYGIEDVAHKDEDGNVTHVTGERSLQYPVYKEDGTMNEFWDVVRAMMFGKSALNEAQEWVSNDFKGLSAKHTAVYQDMVDAGVNDRDAYALINEINGAKKTKEESRTAVQRDILRHSDISGDGKALAYYGMVLADDSETERPLMDRLAEAGADMGEVTDTLMNIHDADNGTAGKREALRSSDLSGDEKAEVYYSLILTDISEAERALMDQLEEDGADMGDVVSVLMGIHDADALSGADASCAKRDAILHSSLTDQEKLAIYSEKVSESRVEDYEAFRTAGLGMDDFLEAHNMYARINETDSSATLKATQLSKWVNDQGYTVEQQAVIKDSFAYYNMMPAEATTYEKLISGGWDSDSAYVVAEAQTRIKKALPNFDENANGTYSQDEVRMAIDAMCAGANEKLYALMGIEDDGLELTNTQKAVIWQMQNKGWKPYKNPYDPNVGQQVYDLLNEE